VNWKEVKRCELYQRSKRSSLPIPWLLQTRSHVRGSTNTCRNRVWLQSLPLTLSLFANHANPSGDLVPFSQLHDRSHDHIYRAKPNHDLDHPNNHLDTDRTDLSHPLSLPQLTLASFQSPICLFPNTPFSLPLPPAFSHLYFPSSSKKKRTKLQAENIL